MSRQAGPTTEILLRRVWEQGGSAIAPDFAMQTLSRCQRIVNAALGRVVDIYAFPTQGQTTIYFYRSIITDAIDIISVRTLAGRTILKVDSLEELFAYSPTWWRATGARLEFWHQIARDILILYPAHATDTATYNIIYSKLTTDLSDFAAHYDTDMELPDDDVDLALILAEIILLLHTRAYDAALKLLEKAKTKIAPYLKELTK